MKRNAADIQSEWLVLRCQSGDDAALAELVACWHPRLYRHARRLVARAHAADDVVQEAWLAIVRGLRRLDDPARFGPWAYRIVTNKCSDWTRARVRARRRGPDGNDRVEWLIDDDSPDPARETADGDGELHALRKAMRELSASHRAALALHYLDGMNIGEIATALGIPPGTVKSRLHHARERLRAILEPSELNERVQP